MYRKFLFSFFICLTTQSAFSQMREEPILLRTKNCDIQGILTMPNEGVVKTVVLIVGGMGYVDKGDMRTNAYKMLSISLAEHSIASVRYDMRGTRASKPTVVGEENVRFSTYVDDVKEWINFLYRRFPRVVVVGHSEGALMSMAAIAEGSEADAFISSGGMGRTIDKVLKSQFGIGMKGQIKEIACNIMDSLSMGKMVENVPVFLRNMYSYANQALLISTMKYNPVKYMSLLTIPVLIIQGSSDIHTTEEDAKALTTANKKAKTVVVDNMCHIMKICSSTDPVEQDEIYRNPASPLSIKFIIECVKFIESI